METVRATATWDRGRYCLWAEPSGGMAFTPEPFDGDPTACLLLEIDENEQETGRIAGAEIVGFLEFDRWETVPKLPILWQLPGSGPLPLDELLKRQQKLLRRQSLTESKRKAR